MANRSFLQTLSHRLRNALVSFCFCFHFARSRGPRELLQGGWENRTTSRNRFRQPSFHPSTLKTVKPT